MLSNTLSYKKRCLINVNHVKQIELCLLFLFSFLRRCYYWLYHPGTRYFGRLRLRHSVPLRGMLCMHQWDDAKPHRNDNNKHTCYRASGSCSLPSTVRSCQPRRSADRLPSEYIASAGIISSSMHAQYQRTPITNSASTCRRAATTIPCNRSSTTILRRRASATLLH